jgi:hypothetical protein
MSLIAALKVGAGELSTAFKVAGGGTMVGSSLSLALIGVGHLVGPTVGIAMIVGLVISFGVLLPVFTGGDLDGLGDISDVVDEHLLLRRPVRRRRGDGRRRGLDAAEDHRPGDPRYPRLTGLLPRPPRRR